MDSIALESWLLPVLSLIAGVVTSLITSQGFWAHQTAKSQKNNAESHLLRGLAHTRIMTLCEKYIDRGWITPEEYEDLITYLYQPYLELGGNGTVKKMVENEINKLPIRHTSEHIEVLRKEL
jgi:hypothetical protein